MNKLYRRCRTFARLVSSASLVFLASALPAFSADWQMRVTDDAGLEITCRQAPVVEAHYVFWGANWDYAGADLDLDQASGGPQAFSGKVAKLGLDVRGQVESPAAGRLRYAWNLNASRDLAGIIGGGLEFNLALDSPALLGKAAEPELLPDNTGWRWAVAPDRTVTVEFAAPVANVYFERGQKNKIRAMFVGSQVAKGAHQVLMTVALPEGGEVAKTLAERYGPVDTSGWFSGALRHDASPVDLSFLNDRPAGRHGLVRAEGDRLVFADGTPARFWGGNIAAYAIFVDEEQIRTQAQRIAALGYNLMRIHHHDSMGWVARPVIDKNRNDSQHLDPEVMDRLDYWIKCLKDEGVYVWLDLHVGRVFKPGDDIPGYDEMARRSPREGAEGKGYCYFNDRIERLMQEFNERYLGHVNRYTGLAYKDDPAVMGLLLTNENDLTCHFGNLMLPDKGNPYHNKLFDAAVRQFAQRHDLPYNTTWQTWVPGPSKLFLADWEHAWNVRMLGHLKRLGVKVPVATTQMWGGMILCGLPPLTAGGIIDVHSYGRAEALSANPRYEDNYVGYLASGQASGKPVAVTEWNVPYPAVDRFTAPWYVATVAALQEWDAPMIYNYSQEAFGEPSRPSTWSSYSDVGLTGVMPAAALMFRRDVSPARQSYCLKLDRQKLYYEGSHPKNLAALRTLVEQSKVAIALPDVKELDWDAQTPPRPEVKLVDDLDRDFIPAGQDFVRSDTGQLVHNWVKGAQAIDTPRTQAAHGFIGGEKVRLADVVIDVSTPKAAVAVSSLDGQPIAASKRLLITAVARAVASPGGRMPMLSEPVEGRLLVRAPAGLKLFPLQSDGKRLKPIEPPYADGAYTIALPPPAGTHWFELGEQ